VGASSGAGQLDKSWQLRRIAWHARSANVISAARLTELQGYCTQGASCDYGADTHSFSYDDNLALPTDAWRALPTIDNDNPDDLPTAQ
jgi:hypothetical protein